MNISENFQRFFFGVICLEIKKAPPMKIKFMDEWSMINFKQVKSSSIYQILKQLNPTYPKDEEGKVLSTTKLNTAQMTAHVNWIERMCAFNGYEMKHVTDEWERLIQQYNR